MLPPNLDLRWLFVPRIATALHPHVRVRTHEVINIHGEQVRASGYRQATVAEAIAMEAKERISERVSFTHRFDDRNFSEKLADWFRLLSSRPSDAFALLAMHRNERYPPMITFEYDDSWDWAQCRWQRSLAIRRKKDWNVLQVLN